MVRYDGRMRDADDGPRGTARSTFPSPASGRGLTLLLPQAHARRVAIGELDASLFEHALDRREIVARRHAAAFLEIDDHVLGNRCTPGEVDLSHVDEAAGCAALRRRNCGFD